jgi:ubiquinone/menaquinone biosynthesis C-methylase UbiE
MFFNEKRGHKMEHIERCVIDGSNSPLQKEHVDRYEFAKQFCMNKKVLDVACGSGYGTKLLSEKANSVVGVDLSSEGIKYAQLNYQQKNITFRQADATNLDFLKDKSFDLVVSFETIEHISDYRKFVSEVERVLRDDGIALISTPNKRYSSPGLEKPKNPFHVIEFYQKDYELLLNEKFKDIDMWGQNLQTPMKQFKLKIVKIVPTSLLQALFSKKMRNNYNLKQMSGMTHERVENCAFFVALCKKNLK